MSIFLNHCKATVAPSGVASHPAKTSCHGFFGILISSQNDILDFVDNVILTHLK